MLQTSAPAGGAGHRTSIRGGGPLSTLVVPGASDGEVPTLWQCLWANVVCNLRAEPEEASRVFPWLAPTRVSDKAGITTTPVDVHEGQAFFGMPRRIRLVFQENTCRHACDLLGIVDDTIITGYVTRPWGTNYTAWDRRHPLSPYYRPKDAATEYLPVHLQSSRIGYRQWLGFAFKAEGSLRVPARTIADFQKRAEYLQGDTAYVRQRARMLACGYAMDNMKPLDFGEALMPLIVGSNAEVNSQVAAQAEKLIKAAEAVSSQLLNSVKLALFGERAKADRDSAVLEPERFRFWADTEQAFYDVLRDAAEAFEAAKDDLQDQHGAVNLSAGSAWLVHLKRHAFQIFDETVPIDSADSDRIEDLINARKFLVLALTGYGANGKIVFDQLNQPQPAKSTKPKKPRIAA